MGKTEFRYLNVEAFAALSEREQAEHFRSVCAEQERLEKEASELRWQRRDAFDAFDREAVRRVRQRKSEIADDLLMVELYRIRLGLAGEPLYAIERRAALEGYEEALAAAKQAEVDLARADKNWRKLEGLCICSTRGLEKHREERARAAEESDRLRAVLAEAKAKAKELGPIEAVQNDARIRLHESLKQILEAIEGRRR